jgi:hypothetical protein
MAIVQITSTGSFNKTDAFLSRMSRGDIFSALDIYARRGVAALAAATPSESGLTAASWDYDIKKSGRSWTISWLNRHVDKTGTPIAIMLQFGHGTGTGGYVQGRDYINPAIRPIFDEIEQAVWREVTSS